MATLVLTAVGTAVGGPIGGAIGALIGQAADSAIFAPKARRGSRMGDLSVQTSSYGMPLPKLFGRMRVAGTVIWATDLQEHRSTSGGGKGRPSTTSYSYSASFAVALSARPIGGVGRIWADGKLLRGVAGDFKTETGYRLHLGGEEQEVDPLIAAAEGIGNTPAYRGLAYAVFQDFQLADYGNRIPSLSFEVEAGAAPIAVGAIAEELGSGLLQAGGTPSVSGYAESGDSIRGTLETLSALAPLSLVETAGTLRLNVAEGSPSAVGSEESGARANGVGGRTRIERRGWSTVADQVSIAYCDPARDWQAGSQRATLGGPGQRADQVALPAALDADGAKAAAETRLAALRAARATARLHLPWRHMELRPGGLVTIGGEPGVWKIDRWTIEQMVLTLDLVGVPTGIEPTGASASAGRLLREPDLLHGPTVLRLIDTPLAMPAADDRPRLLVAAAGPEAGWRRAELAISMDGGASWSAAGRTALPAVMGTALSALPGGGSALFDARASVEIELLNPSMWLESRDDVALSTGANLALLGEELIQFGSAEPIGSGRFRLSRLLRGRRGTEWASSAHMIGEPFVSIEAASLASVEASVSQLGALVRVMAQGIGDGDDGVEVSKVLSGESVRPPAPVHLQATMDADGSLTIAWVRRSRSGWSWLDGGETPLGEESETYRLSLATESATRTLLLATPSYFHSAEDQAGDGGGDLGIEVVQLGTVAQSRPATIIVERP